MQQPLNNAAPAATSGVVTFDPTANPLADAENAVATVGTRHNKKGKKPCFFCDFGCGFGDNSFQAVREHEHSCPERQQSTELGYSEVITWSPVWRWRVQVTVFLVLFVLSELAMWEATLSLVVDLHCNDADSKATNLYFQVVGWNSSAPAELVGKPVTERNGVPGLVVQRGLDWAYEDQDHGRPGVTTSWCSAQSSAGGNQTGAWISVSWEAGGENSYRCGSDGAHDLQVASHERVRLVRVPKLSSGQQEPASSCNIHSDCYTGYYCDQSQTCYGCGYLWTATFQSGNVKTCDTFDNDCSVVTSAQCNADLCSQSECALLTCAEAATRNDTMDCLESADCSGGYEDRAPSMDAMTAAAMIYGLGRAIVGVVLMVNLLDPWKGDVSRKDAEDNQAKKANGDTNATNVSESGGRPPHVAKFLRRICVGCPRVSPDRKPGARQPGDPGFLWCLRGCYRRPAAVFDMAMLLGDENQARAALSGGLDMHTDVLGDPKQRKWLNALLELVYLMLPMGPLFLLLFLVVGVCVLVPFLGIIQFCKRGSSVEEDNEEEEPDGSAYSNTGQLRTLRPASFVLPQGTASPLVLAVLGSSELFETFLDEAGGAFINEEQQQAALRLALLTERRDTARLIVVAGQTGIEAADADGNTVLQYLASQLVDDDPDVMLSFCRGQGKDRADFVYRTRSDGAWHRRVERAIHIALELGADPRGSDNQGRTPLYCAVQHASSCAEEILNLSVCGALLEHGADLHVELNGDAGSHTTPLAVASNSEVAALREWSRTTGSYAGRFRLLDQLHQSETCVVFKGVDLERRRPHDAVAVKIMRAETEWNREVSARREFHLDESYVVAITAAMRISPVERTRRLCHQGFLVGPQDEAEFMLAMPLGECSLFDAVSSERKVGRDLEWVRLTIMHLAQSLRHLHEHGMVHCDVKPRNFCRFKDDNGSRLCLIDLDAACRIGRKMPAWKSGLKASTAYAPPELVTHILLGTTDPPVATASIDSWSLGCVLYELAAGMPLFNADRSDDNLNDLKSKIELLNWRTIDNTRLVRVFAECPACTDTQRSAVQNLIAWCLQADTSLRPSMDEVLAHRFISVDAPAPVQVPATSHFFLSHFQKEAADLVRSLYLMLEKSGCSCWLDMEADNLTLEGMRRGVEDSQCFMLVLTRGVLYRPYCIEEIFVAASLKKDVMLVCETEARFHAFSYDEWDAERKSSKEHAWCLSELAKVESRGEAAAAHMMEVVAGVIHSNKENMIPYRRRNFESNAMIAAILSRNGLYSISSLSCPADQLRTQSAPAGGLTREDSSYARASTAPAALAQSVYVAIVHSTPAGDAAAASLQHALRARGLSVGGMESAKNARRLLIVLTDGALMDATVLGYLRNAVRQEGLSRQRSAAGMNADIDLEVVNCNWSFGSDEQAQACTDPAIARVFQHQEFLAFRPAGGNLNHEHEAMADEIVRRYAARDSVGVWYKRANDTVDRVSLTYLCDAPSFASSFALSVSVSVSLSN